MAQVVIDRSGPLAFVENRDGKVYVVAGENVAAAKGAVAEAAAQVALAAAHAEDAAASAAGVTNAVASITSNTDNIVNISSWYTYALGAQNLGYYYFYNTGVETNIGGTQYRTYPAFAVKAGETLRYTGEVVGTSSAAVVFLNAANGFVGFALQGTASNVVYTDEPVTVPAGATQALVTGRSPTFIERFGVDPINSSNVARLDAAEADIADNTANVSNLSAWFTPSGFDVVHSSYYNLSGVITAFGSDTYRRLPPIPVTPGKPIRITSTVFGNAVALVIWVNASMTYISRLNDGNLSAAAEYDDYEVTPPASAAYALITSYIPTSGKNPAVKLFGIDPVNSENVARLDAAEADIAALQAGAGTSGSWSGKKLLWLGTSIPDGSTATVTTHGITSQNNYPMMVAAMLDATVVNEALSSSIAGAGRFSAKNPGAGDPLGWTNYSWYYLWRSLSMSASDKDELINNWESKWRDLLVGADKPTTLDAPTQAAWRAASYETKLVPNLDADLFLFDHGHNDAALATGGFTGTELMDYFTADPATRDRTTFHGAINYLIDIILAANPRARICFVGHYEDARKSQIALVQSAIAGFWDFPIIETWRKTGWSQQVITGAGPSAGKTMTQVWMPDDLHPHTDTSGDANHLLASIIVGGLANVR